MQHAFLRIAIILLMSLLYKSCITNEDNNKETTSLLGNWIILKNYIYSDSSHNSIVDTIYYTYERAFSKITYERFNSYYWPNDSDCYSHSIGVCENPDTRDFAEDWPNSCNITPSAGYGSETVFSAETVFITTTFKQVSTERRKLTTSVMIPYLDSVPPADWPERLCKY